VSNAVEELQAGLATLEASFIDSIKEHTVHSNPVILEPYDSFEIKGDRLTIFDKSEFNELMVVSPEMGLLVYDADQDACLGMMPIQEFTELDHNELLIGMSSDGGAYGIIGIEEPAIASLSDRGFWGFFRGDDGNKYFFSRGQYQFLAVKVPSSP